MASRPCIAARPLVRLAAVAAAVGLAASAGDWAPATAEPVGPTDPVIPRPAIPAEVFPTEPALGTVLGQFSEVAPSDPFGAMTDLLAASPQQAVFGLLPVPPETVTSGPGTDPLTLAQVLMPQNYRAPDAEQNSPYALEPNVAPSPFARIDAWKGMYALTNGGLGRMPGDHLGQPLPGITPPAGSNPPPGLEQFYPGPGAPPDAMPPIEPPIEPPPALPQPAPPPG